MTIGKWSNINLSDSKFRDLGGILRFQVSNPKMSYIWN